jgi:hypothetical protein
MKGSPKGFVEGPFMSPLVKKRLFSSKAPQQSCIEKMNSEINP